MTVEAVADGSLVLIKVTKIIKWAVTAGYLKEVHDVILKDGHDIDDVIRDSKLNVVMDSISMYAKIMRQMSQSFKDSRERWEIIQALCYPSCSQYRYLWWWAGKFGPKQDLKHICWISSSEDEQKSKIFAFTEWNKNHDKTQTLFRSLEHCVLDVSAGDIFMNYKMPDAIDPSDIYAS